MARAAKVAKKAAAKNAGTLGIRRGIECNARDGERGSQMDQPGIDPDGDTRLPDEGGQFTQSKRRGDAGAGRACGNAFGAFPFTRTARGEDRKNALSDAPVLFRYLVSTFK